MYMYYVLVNDMDNSRENLLYIIAVRRLQVKEKSPGGKDSPILCKLPFASCGIFCYTNKRNYSRSVFE